jgi:hypothetical protein
MDVHSTVIDRWCLAMAMIGMLVCLVFPTCGIAAEEPSPPVVRYTDIPAQWQLYPRDEHGKAAVVVGGVVEDMGWTEVRIDVLRDGILWRTSEAPLEYGDDGAPFIRGTDIEAGLYEYTVDIRFTGPDGAVLERSIGGILCGDVYVIAGQSNAIPPEPEADPGQWGRSFGTADLDPELNPATGGWGVASGDGWGGELLRAVGSWGVRLQSMVADSLGMPTAIINGAVTGTTIDMNMPESDRYDPASIFGRTLLRAEAAGVREHVRALVWYQGENDASYNPYRYGMNFEAIYDVWLEEFPALERIYLVQCRPGCKGFYQRELREQQRRIALSHADIEIIATVGIESFMGCHFNVPGYHRIAELMYRPFVRDLYGVEFDGPVSPPDIEYARFTDDTLSSIELVFTAGHELVWQPPVMSYVFEHTLEDAFFINDSVAKVASGRVEGNRVILDLKTPGPVETVSYLPSRNYPSFNFLYEGPWLMSANGFGVLSFHEVPVVGVGTSVAAQNIASSVLSMSPPSPNPANGPVTVGFRLDTASRVTLVIYDILGRITARVDGGGALPGVGNIVWDGRDNDGRPVGSGIFLFRLTAAGADAWGKVTMLR